MTSGVKNWLLIGAAGVLGIVGLVLVFGGGGNDGASGDSAVVAPEDSQVTERPPDDAGTGAGPAEPSQPAEPTAESTTGGDAGEPVAPSDTPTARPTPGPRQTPTLPPGMRQPEPVTVPDPAAVDGTDPSAVAVAALTAAYSFDTAHDTSPADAMNRAQAWLASRYDTSAYDLDGLRQDVERDWDQWTAHQAFASINGIDPHTTDVDTPDTATRAERRFYVRMTPIGRDAWNGPLVEHQWFAFLERASASDDWRVAELQTPLAHR